MSSRKCNLLTITGKIHRNPGRGCPWGGVSPPGPTGLGDRDRRLHPAPAGLLTVSRFAGLLADRPGVPATEARTHEIERNSNPNFCVANRYAPWRVQGRRLPGKLTRYSPYSYRDSESGQRSRV